MKNTLHTPKDKYLLNKLRLFSARRIEIIIKAAYINNNINVIYAALIMISIRLALKSRSLFSKYLSLGVCNVFFIYVFVNIGMVTGLLPVVGVPLPFISYGGSSMLAVMFGFGLLMNCYINRNIIIEKTNY